MSARNPASASTAVTARPIEPAPTTPTRSPPVRWARFTPWTATATFSTNDAPVTSSPAGNGTTAGSGTPTYSAMPPSRPMPITS